VPYGCVPPRVVCFFAHEWFSSINSDAMIDVLCSEASTCPQRPFELPGSVTLRPSLLPLPPGIVPDRREVAPDLGCPEVRVTGFTSGPWD